MTCRGCGAELADGTAPVTLGRRHGFCAVRCRDRWAVDRVVQLETALTRILVRSRGKARKLAMAALVGNIAPETA